MAKGQQTKASSAEGSKQDFNKSDEIRKIFAENPRTKAKEVIATLGERGIKVTGALVYLVKSKLRAGKRRQKREKAVQAATMNGHGDPIVMIQKVKSMANELGGMQKLKALLEVL